MARQKRTVATKTTGIQTDKLFFEFSPDFARYLIDQQLENYVAAQISLSKAENIPLLKLLSQFSHEQLMELGRQSGHEFLTYLAENRALAYIEKSTDEFVKNQIPFFAREQVVAEDITSISFIRRKALRQLLKSYTQDFELFGQVMEEVDRLIAESERQTFNAYLNIQQESINEINTQLANREQELLEAQELADMGSFMWRFDNKPSTYTPGLMNIFMMKKTNGLDSFMEFVHPDDRVKLRDALDRAFATDGYFECEYRFVKNHITKIIWSKGKVSFHRRKPLFMKGTVMDITRKNELVEKLRQSTVELEAKSAELKQMNDALAFKNSELERMNKELESFNYVASHDLQEPFRKIQLFTNRILEKSAGSLNAFTLEYLDKIVSSSARMKTLIEDLLLFSQANIREENFEMTDLNVLLEEVKVTLAAIIEDKKVKIHAEALPRIKAVPFQFQQVLVNLIMNSIKYTATDITPEIKIDANIIAGNKLKSLGLKPDQHYYEISVKDNGIGFDQADAQNIFKLFHPLHRKDEYSGTGIGLAICKKITQHHEGAITAKSEKGKGSTFSVYLPVQDTLLLKNQLAN